MSLENRVLIDVSLIRQPWTAIHASPGDQEVNLSFEPGQFYPLLPDNHLDVKNRVHKIMRVVGTTPSVSVML